MFVVIGDIEAVENDFADRLAEAMQDAGITGRALAAAVGVQESSVSQWLSRKIESIRAPHLFAVADTLGVDPRWLCTGRGSKKPRVPAELADLSADQIQAILSLIRR